jgi:hypothetical protein
MPLTWVRLVVSSGLGKLPRNDLFDSLRLRLFEKALLLEEVLDAETCVLKEILAAD